MSFASPWPLILIPIWLLLFFFAKFRWPKQRHQVPGSGDDFWKNLAFRSSFYLKLRTYNLLIIGLLFIFAGSGPQLSEEEQEIEIRGLDVMVVLDLSTSMKAMDYQPGNRFEVAVETLKEFVKGRQNDRIGLIVFAGDAYLQVPLTIDYNLIFNVLSSLEMGVIKDGTAIGDALGLAVSHLSDSDAKGKVILLITDGDNNSGSISPQSAKEMAAENGLQVHSVLVGKGGEVPYPMGKSIFGIQQHARVKIPINPDLLKEISQYTGGAFAMAGDSDEFAEVFEEFVADLERTRLADQKFFQPKKPIYFPFLALALFLWFLDFLWIVRLFPLKWMGAKA